MRFPKNSREANKFYPWSEPVNLFGIMRFPFHPVEVIKAKRHSRGTREVNMINID